MLVEVLVLVDVLVEVEVDVEVLVLVDVLVDVLVEVDVVAGFTLLTAITPLRLPSILKPNAPAVRKRVVAAPPGPEHECPPCRPGARDRVRLMPFVHPLDLRALDDPELRRLDADVGDRHRHRWDLRGLGSGCREDDERRDETERRGAGRDR